MHEIQEMTFADFQTDVAKHEGIVLLGCGGDLQEWIEGVTQSLIDAKVTPLAKPEELFSKFIKLTTTGGRTDLTLIFSTSPKINIGAMAMWRLRFGDCSWISDYLVNYASQHGYIFINEDEAEE